MKLFMEAMNPKALPANMAELLLNKFNNDEKMSHGEGNVA